MTPVSLSDKLIYSLVYMLEGIKPLARTSLSDSIVEQLTALIAKGALKPGDRMPTEKALSEQFGVGRTSVREALKSLAAMGLVESQAGEGHFVATDGSRVVDRSLQAGLLLDATKVPELIETRLMLESEAAALAARRATEEQVAEIERQLQAMVDAGDDHSLYLEADLRFHLAIATASQNSILANLLASIRSYLQSWIRETLRRGSHRRAEGSIAEHRRILEAIQKRKAKAARQAMNDHILSSSADLEKTARAAG